MVSKPSWRGPVGPHMVSPEWLWAWDGLRSLWAMNEASGDVFAVGSQPRRATLEGSASWELSPHGASVGLPGGAGNYVAPASNFDPVITDTVTVLAVARRTASIQFDHLVGRHPGWFLRGNTRAEGFYVDFSVKAGGSTTSTGATSLSLTLDQWYVLVGRYDGSTLAIFEDGILKSSVSKTGSMDSTGTMRIGAYGGGDNFEWTGGIALAGVWDRALTDTEIKRISEDPFGPIRPRLWGPELSGVASTVSLYATGDGTLTTLVDEADLTTNIYTSIDDDPASPTDTDWVNNSATTATGFFDVTDMPADFGTMDTAEIVVRYRGQNFGSGTVTLYAQLFQSDESTSLSNEVTVTSVTGDTSFANTTAVTFTGLNTSANKTTWNAARVRLRWATT